MGELTRAQWQNPNECVNLTLYNRKLVYDQDFNIKNILKIDPTNTTDFNTSFPSGSYAHPITGLAEFNIEPLVKSNMTAGEEIIFKPGFWAKSGCELTASINPSACTDGRQSVSAEPVMYTNAMIPEEEMKPAIPSMDVAALPAPEPVKGYEFEVYPNPGAGVYTVTFKNESENNSPSLMTVYNFMGVVIMQQELNNSTTTIDITEKAKGIYYVKVESGSEVKTKKIVYE